MDIRQIKENPAQVSDKDLLEQFFVYNREQMAGYREIENLPEWPFDVNVPKEQEILKSFIGNVIEELTEGFESYNAVYELLQPEGFNMDRVKEWEPIQNHLLNANEELADAMGFYLALFEFSNIDDKDILDYRDCRSLNEIFENGVSMVLSECPSIDYHHIGFLIFHFADLMEDPVLEPLLKGYLEIDDLHRDNIRIILFQIIYHLSTARNLLKSRIWKQTPVMTKELEYQEELVRSFYLFTGYLLYIGVSPRDLYVLFFKKQRLNLWRQNTNY